MLSLIIADDNSDILEGLTRKLDWDRLQIELIGTATSGSDALAMFEQNPSDILLSDIRMPDISGLELASIIKTTAPGTRVILISAYEEFEYARHALRLGVDEYLTKPLGIAEISDALVRTRDRHIERTGKSVASTLGMPPGMAGVDALNALLGGTESEALEEYVQFPNGYFGLVLVGSHGTFPPEMSRLVQKHLHNVGPKAHSFFLPGTRSTIVGVVNLDEAVGESKSVSILREIGHTLRAYAELLVHGPVSVGVSGVVRSISGVRAAYRQADDALERRLLEGYGHVFVHAGDASPPPSPFSYPLGIERAIANAVGVGSRSEVVPLVEEYVGFARAQAKHYPREVRASYRGVLMAIAKTVMGRTCVTRPEIDEERTYLSSLGTLEDMRTHLMQSAVEAAHQVRSESIVATDVKIEQAQDYMATHMQEDLSLCAVAEHVGYSANYFSTLFHRTTGVTFRHYLTDVRIARAKDLLEQGDFRVAEVAERVGIHDARYFGELFKREVGVPPGKYLRSRSRG